MPATFYPYVGAFIWVSILLSIGVLLRAKLPFLQRRLIPSSLIGGMIGFALMNLNIIGMPTADGWAVIPADVFSIMVYHLFAFGFVGIGLMQHGKTQQVTKAHWLRSGALWMALIYCLIYAVQGVTGKGIFELFKLISGEDIFTGFGYLVAPGYAQSPGAAQSFGTIWEGTYGVKGATSVGLAFGAMGFLVAVVIGIPFANKGMKKGWAAEKIDGPLSLPLLTGMMGKEGVHPNTNATTHSANIDNLAFHLGIMGILYAVGYLFALAWSIKLPQGVNGLGFGLLYAWGMIAGIITRKLLARVNQLHIIDSSTTRSITSSTVDYMICAVFLGITVSDIQAILIPFMITVVVVGLITYLVIVWFARRLPEYGFERGLATLGCYTGTVATGLLLLRIVDPEFKSPVAVELAIMNVFILPIIQLVYINLPFVPSEGSIMFPVFMIYLIVMPIALFALRFVRARQW